LNNEEKVLSLITHRYLDNGFKIIIAPNNVHPVVSLQLFVRIGSCWENDNEAGFSHFLEHLVFKSTDKFPDNELSNRAMYLGSNINAYTEFDSTCYYLSLSSQFLAEGLEILSELVRFANFSAKDFRAEKGVVLEELIQYQNDPEDNFVEQIPGHYFSVSPYMKPIIGTKESVKSAKAEDLRDFYKKNYSPGNCFLVVSGDVDIDNLMNEVERFFGDWQGESLCSHIPQEAVYPTSFTVKSFKRNISKPVLAFAVPELSDRDPESYSLGLITKMFALGKQSRLHRRLFVKEKLVEQIKVDSYTGINAGISVILINPRHKRDCEKIIDIFLEEFNQIRHFGFTIEELNSAKTDLLHSYKYSLEYARYLGMNLGNDELINNYRHFFDYPQIVSKITKSSLTDIVKRYYCFEYLGVFSLSNDFQIPETVNEKVRFLAEKRYISNGLKKDFFERKLDNGIKVLMKRVAGRPTVGITAAFNVSQLNENETNRGINMLTSVLLLYGNSQKNYSQLLEFCSRYGIQIDVSAQDEVTLVKVKCFNEYLNVGLELLADILTKPLFPHDHFHNIQKSLISNLERVKDFPHYYASSLWRKQIFGKDSNLLEREGSKKNLRNQSRKKVINWYNSNYSVSGLTLAIVGDFDFEDTLYYCDNIFGDGLRYGSPEEKRIVCNPGPRYKSNSLPENQQGIIHLGGFSCKTTETVANTAFHLLAQILGGDITSRLYDELREKRGLAYSVGFELNTMKDLGYFVAYALVDKQNIKLSLKLIQKVFSDLIENGVTEEELTVAKNIIRGQRLRSEESVLGQAAAIAALDCLGYGYEFYLKREERLQQVTTKDIADVAGKYLREDNLYIHVMK
jgi:zinc protease